MALDCVYCTVHAVRSSYLLLSLYLIRVKTESANNYWLLGSGGAIPPPLLRDRLLG